MNEAAIKTAARINFFAMLFLRLRGHKKDSERFEIIIKMPIQPSNFIILPATAYEHW
jgi:hypothetical protein